MSKQLRGRGGCAAAVPGSQRRAATILQRSCVVSGSHVFHCECITAWLQRSRHCPMRCPELARPHSASLSVGFPFFFQLLQVLPPRRRLRAPATAEAAPLACEVLQGPLQLEIVTLVGLAFRLVVKLRELKAHPEPHPAGLSSSIPKLVSNKFEDDRCVLGIAESHNWCEPL